MKRLFRITALVLSLLLVMSVCAAAEEFTGEQIEFVAPMHPLVSPQETGEYIRTEDRYTNILLLGVDYGFDGYWGSAYKRELDVCHTDAFIVLSINMTTDEVNMISIPRDTVTYIPGVNGMYKLNAAFNCADTIEEGFKNCCNAASWLLGGIEINYYACVDMNAMIKLCDHIGGGYVDVEMDYRGQTGVYYKKGYQHLDGQGLMDYARARRNATVNANDLGRTARQRQVVEAIMRTLQGNLSLVKSSWNFATSGEINFFTNMKLGHVVNLASKLSEVETIGSYVFTGKYRQNCNWNFTFTDQKTRQDVLKTVYGIEADPVYYVSYEELTWLYDTGFDYVQMINNANALLKDAKALDDLDDDQKALIDLLKTQIAEARIAFSNAAYTQDPAKSDEFTLNYKECLKTLNKIVTEMKKTGNEVQKFVHPGEKVKWCNEESYWYTIKSINAYLPKWG